MNISLGLCSVTFRRLDVPAVLAAVGHAGLDGVEWGADVHCPDPATARSVRSATAEAGRRVFSLGSYFRAEGEDFTETLETAVALGAPRVRVWAGSRGSAESDTAHRNTVVRQLRNAADAAAEAGVVVALEYHRNTLTDTLDGTHALLEEVGRENLGVYWQPNVDQPDDDALRHLRALLPWLRGAHCFSWWPFDTRLPLAAREGLWRGAMDILGGSGVPVDVMFEFVPDDASEALVRDAEWLRGVLG
ncbi:sugar phosphate isomerase/epimerase family protein [Arthrobacter sp. NPDC090010]|uniref:sugar phosphate isomerase/epimerase family protein n=1 Tax=Arthrobacter sp. NPDC090010 TaxID=3363942 RepID=UPI00382CB81C